MKTSNLEKDRILLTAAKASWDGYYRSYHDRVVVLRVMHGAQDIKPQDFME